MFFYLCVPETKGRTLEEIDELFANRVSVRGFRTFRTAIMEEAIQDVNERKNEDAAAAQAREVEHAAPARRE